MFKNIQLNKIYNENCLETMKRMPNNYIDLVVTSPPYDNLRQYDNNDNWDFDTFKTIANRLYLILKKGGVIVWVVNDATTKGSETLTSFKQALYFKEIGFNIYDTMIFQKENYVPLTHRRYEQSFEYMFVITKGNPKTFNPIMIPCKQAGKVEKYGDERRQNFGKLHSMRKYKDTEYKATKNCKIKPNIFSYALGRERTGHPATFPEQLAHDHIISWSNENDIVYDPFCGSGTTCKMALINNRRYIGSEISEKYCQLAEKRIKNIVI